MRCPRTSRSPAFFALPPALASPDAQPAGVDRRWRHPPLQPSKVRLMPPPGPEPQQCPGKLLRITRDGAPARGNPLATGQGEAPSRV